MPCGARPVTISCRLISICWRPTTAPACACWISRADPEAGRKVINDWVANQTANKIQDLIPPVCPGCVYPPGLDQCHLFQRPVADPVRAAQHPGRPLYHVGWQPGQRSDDERLAQFRFLPGERRLRRRAALPRRSGLHGAAGAGCGQIQQLRAEFERRPMGCHPRRAEI